MTVLSTVVLGPWVSSLSLPDYFAHPLLADYACNLVFNLRDLLPLHFSGNVLPTAVNGSLWTIALELACYGALALALDRPQLTLWLVLPATVVLSGLSSTPGLQRAGRFGDLSYGLYIYAFPD